MLVLTVISVLGLNTYVILLWLQSKYRVGNKPTLDIKENDYGEFFDGSWVLDINSIIADLKLIDKKKNHKNV